MSSHSPKSPLRISRSKLELFTECPRCFWLDVAKGIGRPPSYPYTLSSAVDYLLKEEFDVFRSKGDTHPLMAEHGIPAKLFPDQKQLAVWRNNFRGISHRHPQLGATLYGAVDDVFEFPGGELAVVDYKSTGSREITIYPSYQRQMDIYTWLLEQNGYRTLGKGYFVFYQVDKAKGFDGRLPFRGQIREVATDVSRVEDMLRGAVEVLQDAEAPPGSPDCAFCSWHRAVVSVTR